MSISIFDVISGQIPFPTFALKWGEAMPEHVSKALKETKATALLYDENNEPLSLVVWAKELENWREKPWDTFPAGHEPQELPKL